MGAKRTFLWISCLLAAVLLFTHHAGSQIAKPSTGSKVVVPAGPPQVRMRWQDFISGPDGAKRLASLEKAVKKMKSLDTSPKTSADYRRSWAYWANIHGYYGTQSPDGTVADQIQWLKTNGFTSYVHYYQGITDQTPPDSIASAIWATCQHSNPPQQANFFGWHRMYLYYFERVLRWAANDNTLRLPYWDYTNPAELALPAEFRDSDSPLYDGKRKPGINSGSATLKSNSTNVNTLLPIANYFSYEGKIEEGVHGYVHCTVGPTCPVAHMGDVPVAGNDPVFYSHHANIDRLWACWQTLHPTPGGAWQNQTFSFVDETGTLQTKPVKNFLDPTTLGYAYDNASSCARPGKPLLAIRMTPFLQAGAEDRSTAMLGAAKGISISAAQTSIDVPVPKPQLEKALTNLESAGAVELVLRDVTADSHPGVLFDIYVAKTGDPATRQRVGTISWFGAFRKHGGQRGPVQKTLRYDVTSEVRDLGGPALATSGLTVMIEATDGTVPTDPTKTEEHRKSVMADFRKEANLKIGAIELRGAPPAQRLPKKK
jgi:hypothetical protein